MRHSLDDVVRRALEVLDDYGLADLSMRRLASELGLQPSALYHHVANKQELLALLADEVLRRGGRPTPADVEWSERVTAICLMLRDAMLAWRDGAELVSTVYAYGLGAATPYADLETALLAAGFTDEQAMSGAHTLLYVTFGHTGAAQTHMQAASAGAIDSTVDAASYADANGLEVGLGLIITGLREKLPADA